ncbi:selenium metabolism-associated LysR family transcriptional regulator [Clostridium sp. Marseille-P299]|uniref:selenium metabolism-associated LysR family transcriptional regulator n=1 Tax=Clostridium sp. Marseille-P299 TaxID=1805477 RepID=UPI00082D5112|nr:selenium metabolism-associated LysR family transcriptional regulator [Clostridium sp. Marseille-P299]
MDFRQLEAFIAVVDLKSFSKAAEKLYLTQPTVSAHIRTLEKELGTTLIARTTKLFQMTYEGERFYRYAKRLVELKDAALQDINMESKKIIRLGASTIPSTYLLPQLLPAFRKKQPNVYFDVRQGDSSFVEERILDGTLDIGLIGTMPRSSECHFEVFCQDELVIATPATSYYIRLKTQKATIHELLKEPIIMRERGSGTQKEAYRYLDQINVSTESLNVVTYINDPESIKGLIVNGMGISMISGFAVKDLEERGQILTFRPEPPSTRNFYIIYKKKIVSDHYLNEFKYFVKHFYKN